MCPAGSSVFWLGSFSFHKAKHTSLLFTEQSWSKLALKMVYPRKTVMNFARKSDVLCHAWVGDYFAPTEPFLMCDSVALGGDGGIEVDSISNFTV